MSDVGIVTQEIERCYHGDTDGICPREDGCHAPYPCEMETVMQALFRIIDDRDRLLTGLCAAQFHLRVGDRVDALGGLNALLRTFDSEGAR